MDQSFQIIAIKHGRTLARRRRYIKSAVLVGSGLLVVVAAVIPPIRVNMVMSVLISYGLLVPGLGTLMLKQNGHQFLALKDSIAERCTGAGVCDLGNLVTFAASLPSGFNLEDAVLAQINKLLRDERWKDDLPALKLRTNPDVANNAEFAMALLLGTGLTVDTDAVLDGFEAIRKTTILQVTLAAIALVAIDAWFLIMVPNYNGRMNLFGGAFLIAQIAPLGAGCFFDWRESRNIPLRRSLVNVVRGLNADQFGRFISIISQYHCGEVNSSDTLLALMVLITRFGDSSQMHGASLRLLERIAFNKVNIKRGFSPIQYYSKSLTPYRVQPPSWICRELVFVMVDSLTRIGDSQSVPILEKLRASIGDPTLQSLVTDAILTIQDSARGSLLRSDHSESSNRLRQSHPDKGVGGLDDGRSGE